MSLLLWSKQKLPLRPIRRKAAVAAAIARAKAKKAAQAQETDTVSAPSNEGIDTQQDPRKAAVAAAIARVKAKQARAEIRRG
ncbi:electron transport complex protein RnfC [Hafnia alvei]|uniref:Electron transport complex protein RnfC n=1 Tax=Hafnia alvei TaxID=569 RepID=A0A377PIG0_HAFAL|nr:electron transport complex protein RnfC [Hafnia alvei]